MATNKTKPEDVRPDDYLDSLDDDKRKADARRLAVLMREVTGQPAVMWGGSIVGFGSLHYRYESGREGDTAVVSFSPRKNALAIYGVAVHDKDGTLLAQLGPHETGKGCLYIKDMDAIDTEILAQMVRAAVAAKSSIL